MRSFPIEQGSARSGLDRIPEATSDVLNNFGDRRKLAEKWAVLPGEEEADNDVVIECSSQLART